MLVLARREGQDVVIPEYGITIRVLETRRFRCKLGVTAPRHIKVLRDEHLRHTEGCDESEEKHGK